MRIGHYLRPFAIAAFALAGMARVPSLSAQCDPPVEPPPCRGTDGCPCPHPGDCGELDLTQVQPDASTTASRDAQFAARAAAVTSFDATHNLRSPCPPIRGDYGEDYQVRLFGRLASGDPARITEAINSLRELYNFRQTETDWHIGTDSPLPDLLASIPTIGPVHIPDLFIDGFRHGDYDILMNALVAVLYKYGNLLPPDVYDQVLSMIDLTSGPVDHLDFGLTTLGRAVLAILACHDCSLICVDPCGPPPLNPACCVCEAELVACIAAIADAKLTVPETENHLNNIYVARYLTNQILLARTGNPAYDNDRPSAEFPSSFTTFMLQRLAGFLRNDFVEYNSHPYQDYTMFALLNLASYANQSKVRNAAEMVLNYISAKVAVSSNDARRSTPFRRKQGDAVDEPDMDHNCAEMIESHCTDPQTPFYMMYAGVTEMARHRTAYAYTPAPGFLPPTYPVEFQWAAISSYRVPPLIYDLFVHRDHRTFYQYFKHCNPDCIEELYFSSPSYSLSAGGKPADYAYRGQISTILGAIPGSDQLLHKTDDLGVAVPTVLIPTISPLDGTDVKFSSRVQMIRFRQADGRDDGVPEGGANMGVWRNFACGRYPVIPDNYPHDPPEPDGTGGTWTFINKGRAAGQPGYFVGVYRKDDFGFLEAYDTWLDSSHLLGPNNDVNGAFAAFRFLVRGNNGRTFSSGDNTYVTLDQKMIQFHIGTDNFIVTVNGVPPYDPNRTNGDVINVDPAGLVTIRNPYTHETLMLDARDPQNPVQTPGEPLITVPGPVHFGDTCLGTTSYATLNVCNTGLADLMVYKVHSDDQIFEVTEPSSGYPVAISPDFCFPFQVRFTPAATGPITGTLRISNSDPNRPFVNVQVTGTGIQQKLATYLTDAGWFGEVCVGAFRDLPLTLSNTGDCRLTVSSVTSSTDQFQVPAVATFPLVIAPGGSAIVPIRFKPTSLGDKTAFITINSNDPLAATVQLTVTGTAPPGDIRVTGSTDFGDVCAGVLAEKTISACNVGRCNLNVSRVAFDPPCADFTLVQNPFPAVVSHDSCLNVVIRFTPTSCGPKSCTLKINSDDPDTPVVTLTVTANTPCSDIDVPSDVCFASTVIQTVGACTTSQAFPILNHGLCPIPIRSIALGGANAARYSFSGLPSFPINLQPGHTVGDGNLRIVFAPTTLARNTPATISVTYESDPVSHATMTVTRLLNGEGVRTGARVLVRGNGVPVASAEKIMIQRVTGNANRQQLNTVDSAMNLPLTTVTPTSPCSPFQYHREYGTVSNGSQLLPGSYRVTATATVGGRRLSKVVGFDAATCTFNPTIIVDLP